MACQEITGSIPARDADIVLSVLKFVYLGLAYRASQWTKETGFVLTPDQTEQIRHEIFPDELYRLK